ncbi:MAG: oxygenase MpaB family protein [Bacteroidota bacterium]
MKRFPSSLLDDMRLVMDEPADLVVKSVMDSKTLDGRKFWKFMADMESNDRSIPDEFEEIIYEHIPYFEVLPDFTDHKLLKTSEELFLTNTQDFFLLLGAYSLPYCYAAANGAKVLFHSGRMKKDAVKRLQETGMFVFNVMEPNAFTGIGLGFISCLKVRLLHAMVRYQILKHGHWNEQWGMPINQEDMAGTNIAFSVVVLDGLKKLGYELSDLEEQALLHRWKVIGTFLGLREELLLDNRKESFFLRTNIEKRQFRSSEEGKALINQLISEFDNAPEQIYPKGFASSFIHYMIGDEFAEMLDVPDPNWTTNLISFNKRWNSLKDRFEIVKYIRKAKYDSLKKQLLTIPET